MSKYLTDNVTPDEEITTTNHLEKPMWGIRRTKRTSFEITPELDEKLDNAIWVHQLRTKRRISKSAVIRQALLEYLSKEIYEYKKDAK